MIADSATVVYGWGDSPGLSIESSFTATYKLTSATSATASRRRGESRAQADMVKVDLATLKRFLPRALAVL